MHIHMGSMWGALLTALAAAVVLVKKEPDIIQIEKEGEIPHCYWTDEYYLIEREIKMEKHEDPKKPSVVKTYVKRFAKESEADLTTTKFYALAEGRTLKLYAASPSPLFVPIHNVHI